MRKEMTDESISSVLAEVVFAPAGGVSSLACPHTPHRKDDAHRLVLTFCQEFQIGAATVAAFRPKRPPPKQQALADFRSAR
jgi:peptidoglycan/LPS O-acetylase OafA/YrhL